MSIVAVCGVVVESIVLIVGCRCSVCSVCEVAIVLEDVESC